MKNIFKIVFMLCLSIFVVTGCADDIGTGNGIASIDNTGNNNTGGDNTGGDNTGGDNTSGDNTGGDNTGGDNTCGDNTGGDNTGGDNTGSDNTGGDNTGGDNTGGDNTGGDNTGGDNTGGDNTGGDNTCGDNTGGDNTGGDNTGSDNTGGDNTGGDNTGGDNTGGDNTGGDNTGGDNTSGDNTGGNNTDNTDNLVLTKLVELDSYSAYSRIIYGEAVDGKRYVWGDVGELAGTGNKDNVTTPKEVDFTITKKIQISGRQIIGVLTYLLTDKGLYGFGDNNYGQLGNGEVSHSVQPVKILNGNVKDVIIKEYDIKQNPYYNYYVITDDGLYIWGDNRYYQAGNGTTDNVTKPYKLEGITGNVKEIIVKEIKTVESYYQYGLICYRDVYHLSYYVLTDAGLYTWGYDVNGNTDITTPQEILKGNIKKFIIKDNEIKDTSNNKTTYTYTYYALTDDGLYAWGDNKNGKVGKESPKFVTTPYKAVDGNIEDLIIDESSDKINIYVLSDTGIYIWGDNEYGQVGNGDGGLDYKDNAKKVLTPHKVEGIAGNIKEIKTAHYYTVYVTTDTGLYAWGRNEGYQVGNGDVGFDYYKNGKIVTKPYKVEEIEGNIKEVKTSEEWNPTIYVLTDKGLYAWGFNYYGQVGNGYAGINYNFVKKPYKVDKITGNIKEVKFVDGINGFYTIQVITDDGLYTWGYNRYGLVGNGDSGCGMTNGYYDENRMKIVSTPYKTVNGNIKEFINTIYDDGYHKIYVVTDTGLYSWGSKGGCSGSDYSRREIEGNVKKIISNTHTLIANKYNNIKGFTTYYALMDTGLYAWGDNTNGQIGNGKYGNLNDDGNQNIITVTNPYKIMDGNIEDIIIYSNKNNIPNYFYADYYIVTDTGLYTWNKGTIPHKLDGITGNIKGIKGSNDDYYIPNYLYVLTDTGLYAWGKNGSGQIGNGTTDEVTTPHKIEGITGNIKEVKIDDNTVYVITDAGFYAWGSNGNGAVGSGRDIYNYDYDDGIVTIPYKVKEITGNIKEVIKVEKTVYVLTDTGLYAWGDNKYGQVGNGELNGDYGQYVTTPYKVQIKKQN